MSNLSDVLWLSTSSSFNCFARPLLCYLSQHLTVAQWQYCQTQDEGCSLDEAVFLLHDYLKSGNKPVHLVGHSTGGLLGLLYARQYPEKVKSLTLLAVGVDAAIDWQAHYYTHRQCLSRQATLNPMAYNLFGYHKECTMKHLVKLLEQDLDCSLSPHSLFQRISVPPEGVSVPLMVCGSRDDMIVESETLQGWRPWLKQGDRLWECLEGKHFFHFSQFQLVGEQLLDFWQALRLSESLCSILKL